MIHRIDVRLASDSDPLGEAVRQQIREFGSDVGPIATRRIFLIDSDADGNQIRRIADELLADPIVERADLLSAKAQAGGGSRIEIHLKPGVMDPVAGSTEMAIRDMGLPVAQVRTGRAYVMEREVPREQLEQIASKILANGVIESVHFDRFLPSQFEVGRLGILAVCLVKVSGHSL